MRIWIHAFLLMGLSLSGTARASEPTPESSSLAEPAAAEPRKEAATSAEGLLAQGDALLPIHPHRITRPSTRLPKPLRTLF